MLDQLKQELAAVVASIRQLVDESHGYTFEQVQQYKELRHKQEELNESINNLNN